MQKRIVKGLGNTEQKCKQLYLCSHKKEKEKKRKKKRKEERFFLKTGFINIEVLANLTAFYGVTF